MFSIIQRNVDSERVLTDDELASAEGIGRGSRRMRSRNGISARRRSRVIRSSPSDKLVRKRPSQRTRALLVGLCFVFTTPEARAHYAPSVLQLYDIIWSDSFLDFSQRKALTLAGQWRRLNIEIWRLDC